MAVYRSDSFLAHLPADLPLRERVWLEGVGFSVAVADLAFERLRALLLQISDEGLRAAESIPLALADAWTYVDGAHRLSDLLGCGAGTLGTSDLGRLGRDFTKASKPILELRNSVQHVGHTEFARAQATGIPIWGVVSWAAVMPQDRIRTFSLSSGGGGNKIEHQLVNPLGRSFEARLDHVHLEAFGDRANLSGSHRAMAAFVNELENVLVGRFADARRDWPGGLVSMDIDLSTNALEEAHERAPGSTD
ncbi:hypothetical protein [Pendulispora albinea]|uniref:Uncharacterized protein n=1 Tax=Pendulispora albinea TaxID=2741071 RepID=A0ABZ2LYS4_9BACT